MQWAESSETRLLPNHEIAAPFAPSTLHCVHRKTHTALCRRLCSGCSQRLLESLNMLILQTCHGIRSSMSTSKRNSHERGWLSMCAWKTRFVSWTSHRGEIYALPKSESRQVKRIDIGNLLFVRAMGMHRHAKGSGCFLGKEKRGVAGVSPLPHQKTDAEETDRDPTTFHFLFVLAHSKHARARTHRNAHTAHAHRHTHKNTKMQDCVVLLERTFAYVGLASPPSNLRRRGTCCPICVSL